MPKFNSLNHRARIGDGPVTVQPGTEHVNHQGGAGFTRDDKSDAYLLATTSLDLTGDAFYERGDARVKRFTNLIAKTAVADPDWTYRFLTWLRTKGNIRTAALVGGVEAARALAKAGIPGGRHMVATVLRRADEPGEAIAYHYAVHGRRLPMSVKRGIGDAATRLYNERSLLKYDTASHGVRFADVLAITHPTPDPMKAHWQGDLFQYAIDRRYGRDVADGARNLDIIRRNAILRESWAAGRTDLDGLADRFREAGMTWEDVLSALGNKVDKAALWRAMIPSMGFMARLRNLRNFDQAGLSDADVQPVIDMLMDPDQVRASRQLPMRFLSAFRAAGANLRWGYALERALDVSVENIPLIHGNTLIMVDTSGSMHDPLSAKSDLKRWDAAVVFGLALARRCQTAAVVSYSAADRWSGGGGAYKQFIQTGGASLLSEISRWTRDGYFIGGGTDTAGVLKSIYNGQDRVVILTDEQDGHSYYHGSGLVTDAMPKDRPLYTCNLAWYVSSHAVTDRNRITLGGLTDQMFGLIPTIEASYPGGWPWSADETISGLPSYERPVGAVTRSTVPEGSQGGEWNASDGGWTGRTTGR